MLIIRDDDYIRLNYLSDFIEDFVAPSQKSRLHYLLSKPKRHEEIGGHLHHSDYLDSRYTRSIAKRDQNADRIYELMTQIGATSPCFTFGVRTLGYEGELKDILQENVGYSIDFVVYCRSVKVGYWQNHDGYCYILSKK